MKTESNGIHIHVEDQGTGDLGLVCLHYYGGSTRTWKYVTSFVGSAQPTPLPLVVDPRSCL